MPSVHVDTGITGAKRQSWREGNPRDVLKRLIDKNPGATEDEIQAECWALVQKNSEQMLTVFEYWFANNWHSLMKPTSRGRPRGSTSTPAVVRDQQVREAVGALRAKIEEKINEKIKIALLTMILPTGKQLQHSTREELVALGGWTERVAAKLKPGQTVLAAKLSERTLRALYEA